MNDILPDSAGAWHRLERVADDVFGGYGYQRIRVPIAERTELFQRSIGEVTDIVEKEMYTFADRGGDSLSLRPEGTAGVVRAAIQHGLLYNQVQRLWYSGPMFRYERPQKGRYRQFHQFGVEAFGLAGPDVDAEVIMMSARLWRQLGIRSVKLQINTLGTPASRQRYREYLTRYFRECEGQLDADSQRRLQTNPLRILDSKAASMQPLLADAPSLLDHLDAESATHFAHLRSLLDEAGIRYQVNPRLVRGLDYYTRTVFEWVTDRLGAQDAVCSGGRYDGLVGQLGGHETPGIGFALGVERLLALMQADGAEPDDDTPHVYLAHAGHHTLATALNLAEHLRDHIPGVRVLTHAGGGSFKAQLKRADRSGAPLALIVGEDEMAAGRIQVKPLRSHGKQETHTWQELPGVLGNHLGLPTADKASPVTSAEER